eukprot:gene5812-6510_t
MTHQNNADGLLKRLEALENLRQPSVGNLTKEIVQYSLRHSPDFDKYLALEKAERLKIVAREHQHKKGDYFPAVHAKQSEKIGHPVEQFRNYVLALFDDKDYEKVVEAIGKHCCGLQASLAPTSSSTIPIDHSAIQARFDSLTRYKQANPYQKQKGKLQQDLEFFLWSLPIKKTVATATHRNVIDFLIWKDQFGKIITNTNACKSQTDSSSCSCYRGLTDSTIDSYIGKLFTIFIKHNGRSTSWKYELQLGNPATHYSVKEYHMLVLEN